MKIAKLDILHYRNSINSGISNKKINRSHSQAFNHSNPLSINYYVTNVIRMPRSVSFLGRRVHIVDGGDHAANMQHFAKAISNNMDIEMHNVEINPKEPNVKQLKSLEQELKNLNTYPSTKLQDEYVAIPALASVPILNIQDQYNKIMEENKKLNPQNIKANKKQLLNFLEKLYNNPEKYSRYIGYMDPSKQGIEYTYGVIQEINKLVKKGAKVYVPSGHPQDETLKWMAERRGLKPELYHYISTGEDIDGKINELHKKIKSNNWYDFNLLSLSDANIVGVKSVGGAQDYMFAAYDSCITDGARGVYNFTPVRIDGEIIGYSYTDSYSNEYPFDEFPSNDKLENLNKFVGKYCFDVLASDSETEELKNALSKGLSTAKCADKLYAVKDVFTENEIKEQKLNIQGKYTDKSLKLFFDKNQDGKVIFKKCDCEGSGKPSVLPMWGSCFALFNSIAREIVLDNLNEKAWKDFVPTAENGSELLLNLDSKITDLKSTMDSAAKRYNYARIEHCANEIIKLYDIKHRKIPAAFLNTEKYKSNIFYTDTDTDDIDAAYDMLINALFKQGKYNEAKGVANKYINILCKRYKDNYPKIPIDDLRSYDENKRFIVELNERRETEYIIDKIKWDNATWFQRLFLLKPEKPYKNTYNHYPNGDEALELLDKIRDNYAIVTRICRFQGEKYPANVCAAVVRDFRRYMPRADEVIQRRIDGVEYVGDLYPEIKEEE